MGLILSRNLLLEGANSQFAIPEYKRVFNPIYEQSYLLEIASDFNEEIRNANLLFLELYSPEYDALNEGARWDKIVRIAKNILDALIKIVDNARKKFSEIFNKAMSTLALKNNASKHKRNKKAEAIPEPTYIGTLSKALAEKDYTVNITDIKPTDALTNKDFPKAKLDAFHRVDFMMHDLSHVSGSLRKETDLTASKNLVDAVAADLSEFRKSVGDELFGNFSYDPSNLTNSASKVAIEAFGSEKVQSVPVTVELFVQAKTNKDNAANITSGVQDLSKSIDSSYANLKDIIQVINKDISGKFAAKDITSGPYVDHAAQIREIISSIQNSSNIITDAIGAHLLLVGAKTRRIIQIYGAKAQSTGALDKCDEIVLSYLKDHEGNPEDVIVGKNDVAFGEAVEDFNYIMAIIKESYRELSYNDLLHSVLEADGDNNQQQNQNAQQQTTQQTTTTTTTNNQQNNEKSKVLGIVDRVMKAFADLWTKFQDRIKNFVALDAAWWNQHKVAVSKLDISKVKVNQWYNYDLDKFTRDSYINWDPNSPDLESDDAMEKAIYNKIGGTPTVADDASFNEKVKSLYYTRYIDNQGENSGVEFGSIGMNKQDMDRYLDDFVKGFNGGILKSIRDQSNKLDQDYKRLKADYNRLAQQYKENTANNPQQKTETQNANNTANQTGENKANNESTLDILTYTEYIEEAALTSKERNDLPASEFGLPKQRRFPLNDEKHVLLAIRFFNHVEEEYEKELARNIIKKIKAFDMADKVHVGKNNRFKPYWEKSGLANTNIDESSVEELFNFNLADTLYLVNNNEATFEVNDELKQQVGNTADGGNKELDDKIQRFYQFNTKAIGAKMTQAVAAYKQYIALYKAVLGGNKQQNKNQNTKQQTTQQTTTTTTTNNQQNQNNQQK